MWFACTKSGMSLCAAESKHSERGFEVGDDEGRAKDDEQKGQDDTGQRSLISRHLRRTLD